ncbi:MAG: N-acetylmuramoyl-L-alanine amidase [Oscillospiraceae bacterium]|nr:N-acetylmuramoyl-L-alanine amidase [Oscillospiraceae bacterium]
MKKRILIPMIILLLMIIIISINTTSKATDENDNIVVVLDPGHGGNDPGAVNTSLNLIERDLNLKISQYTKQELDKYAGIRTFQTHYGVPVNQDPPTLQQRADIANGLHADLLISQHINAIDSTTKVQGAEVYVTRDTSQDIFNKNCTKLGNIILNNLSALGIKNRGIFTKPVTSQSDTPVYPDGQVADWYGIIRNPMFYGIPAMIVEHCYIDSSDTQFINTDAKLQKIGQADAKAIVDFYGLQLKTLNFAVESPDNNVTVSKTVDFSGWAIGPQTNQVNIYIDDKLVKSNVERIERTDIQAQYPGFETTTPNPGFSYSIDTTKLTDGPHKLKAELIGANGEKQTLCRYITVDNSKYVSGVEFNIPNITDINGSKINLNYSILPTTAVNKNVTFTSDNEDVATVDSLGKVTLNSAGIANITVKTEEGEYTATCTVTATELGEDESFNLNSPLVEEDTILTGIPPETLVKNVKANIQTSENLKVVIKDKDGVELNDNQPVPTGSHVLIMDSNDTVIKDDLVLVYGDLNGETVTDSSTGNVVDAVDLLLLKRHLLQVALLQFPYNVTADINKDNVIDAVDLLLLKRHLLGIQLIT